MSIIRVVVLFSILVILIIFMIIVIVIITVVIITRRPGVQSFASKLFGGGMLARSKAAASMGVWTLFKRSGRQGELTLFREGEYRKRKEEWPLFRAWE